MATAHASASDAQAQLERAGLPSRIVADWLEGRPDLGGDYERDTAASSRFWLGGADLLAMLPSKPKRGPAELAAADAVLASTRDLRDRFLTRHVETVYRALTRDYGSFVRVEQLAYDAAAIPGLVPTREQVAAERDLLQRDKEGLEIDQGIFL